jgi:uncharacterized protein
MPYFRAPFFYTATMTTEFNPTHLDVQSFCRASTELSASESLSKYERLAEESVALDDDLTVTWSDQGDWRETHGQPPQAWLHIEADATVALTCQRCLTRLDAPIFVDRWFRFVADEATAEAQDDDAEEDLLVTARDYNLRELVEDELLMDLPMVPVHEECPVPVKMEAIDDDFEEANATKPNPFAALVGLKKANK